MWSQLVFLSSFAAFWGWRGVILVEPLYLVSSICALVTVRRLAGSGPWLSQERSTLAFLAGAILAPAIPALLNDPMLRFVGIVVLPGVPGPVETWLRAGAGILALVPAMLVLCPGLLSRWVGIPPEREWQLPVRARDILELGVEAALWAATLWATVHFKAHYSLNLTYLTFLPPLGFALFRGVRLATLALAANAVIATTLWSLLHWASVLSVGDLRLLIAINSVTILVLATVVDERQRSRAQVQNLLTTERVLRESEEYFRTMANSAPLMIWVSGPDGLRTFANTPLLDFVDRSVAEGFGGGWMNKLHPDDLGVWLATYDASFNARRSYDIECRIRRADGEYRWILDNGKPLYKDGEFVGFIGACIDVTERKLIEERLRASEVRLLDAQRLAKVGSWERDLTSDTIFCSDEMLRMLGPPAAPLHFPAFLDRIHPNDRENVLETDSRVRSTDVPIDVDYRIVRLDGTERFIHSIVESIRDNHGSVVRLVGATQDITEQIKARELLSKSEERLKNAERLAHVGHWQWDFKTNCISGSDEMYRIFGKPLDYIPHYDDFLKDVTPKDRPRVVEWVNECLAEKRGKYLEYQIVWPNGDVRTVSTILEVSIGEDGLPACLFGACQDITDSKREQEESFTRQKLESVGTLANGIAHDFNNLLGGVLAQAELALEERSIGLSVEDQLRNIREAAIRGSEIVRQLMIYAGNESDTADFINVSRIAREMIALLKVSVSKHATLVTDLDEVLQSVRGSAGQIRQVLMNLVTNASEAIGDRDGVIRVATRRVTLSRADAISSGLAPGDCVQLEVSDSGSGMAPETKARMFDPFFTTKGAGHGLGLAVVQGIVRSLNGSIHVTSEPGSGATFRILLPLAERTAESLGAPRSEVRELANTSGSTVLIVEDEAILRRAVARTLRKAGFETLEAADGSAALDVLRMSDVRIDLILLDLTLPKASSQQVIREVARTRPELKVILTSAYSEETAMRATLNTPFNGRFIRKPFESEDLIQMLRTMLSS